MSFIIPGATKVQSDTPNASTVTPILNSYSPRLFGSPPQLTPLNDIRSLSRKDDSTEGPTGDFYLKHILRDAQIAYFTVGHAMFTGGMSSHAHRLKVIWGYKDAMASYGVDPTRSISDMTAGGAAAKAKLDNLKRDYEKALTNDDGKYETAAASSSSLKLRVEDIGEDTNVLTNFEADEYIAGFGPMAAALMTSLSVQQPFYTFESDWNTYINNVKMMIDSAVIMLGLGNAVVRVGDEFLPVGGKDTWGRYRFLTTDGYKDSNGKSELTGETDHYVSYMIDPKSISESYTNTTTTSAIYDSVIRSGESIGKEIAFITNSSRNSVDDMVVNIAGDAIQAAEKVMTALSGGVGRFTAAIASSMSRSFVGDHTIFPEIFSEHQSNASDLQMTVKLRASGGDPFSYLTEILVPLFYILAMVLPQMSKNSAAAYTYPPLVQCSIPGMWNTRLGIVSNVQITKNPEGNDISVYGFPLSVDVAITVKDLQHVMVSSPIDKPSLMLNNHTMFDYIAQCCGVDKYRPNGAIRLLTRAALASHFTENIGNYLGDALTSDFWQTANRFLGTERF